MYYIYVVITYHGIILASLRDSFLRCHAHHQGESGQWSSRFSIDAAMTLVTISMSKWLWLQLDPPWVLKGVFIDFWWCDHSAAFVSVGADGFFGFCRFELWVKTRRYVDLCVNWDWNPLHPSAAWKMNEDECEVDTLKSLLNLTFCSKVKQWLSVGNGSAENQDWPHRWGYGEVVHMGPRPPSPTTPCQQLCTWFGRLCWE